MTKKRTIIDPAGGWRYGFPKELPPEIARQGGTAINKWLLSLGYPEADLKYPMRFWEQDDDESI
jgi:hypothetical protein